MAKHIEIHISASLPSDNDELGHEAVVAAKAPIQAVVDALAALGLDVTKKSGLVDRRGPRTKADPTPVASAPAPVSAAVSDEDEFDNINVGHIHQGKSAA